MGIPKEGSVGNWLVVGPPLWKIWVRQLGWLFPMHGKIKNGNQTTNQETSEHFQDIVDKCNLFPLILNTRNIQKSWFSRWCTPICDHTMRVLNTRGMGLIFIWQWSDTFIAGMNSLPQKLVYFQDLTMVPDKIKHSMTYTKSLVTVQTQFATPYFQCATHWLSESRNDHLWEGPLQAEAFHLHYLHHFHPYSCRVYQLLSSAYPYVFVQYILSPWIALFIFFRGIPAFACRAATGARKPNLPAKAPCRRGR